MKIYIDELPGLVAIMAETLYEILGDYDDELNPRSMALMLAEQTGEEELQGGIEDHEDNPDMPLPPIAKAYHEMIVSALQEHVQATS